MTVKIAQVISKVLDMNRHELSSHTIENYILSPDAGKKLKNIRTGRVYNGPVSLSSREVKEDYIEV